MCQQTKPKFVPVPVRVERIGKACLDAAFHVHSVLGPGLLETVYEKVLLFELSKRGLATENQKTLPVVYDENYLDAGLRMDILVEKLVILELKAVEKMNPLSEAQLLTYLKLSGLRLGYLINFNVVHLKDGISRRVL